MSAGKPVKPSEIAEVEAAKARRSALRSKPAKFLIAISLEDLRKIAPESVDNVVVTRGDETCLIGLTELTINGDGTPVLSLQKIG
jgi:hypothetical protein